MEWKKRLLVPGIEHPYRLCVTRDVLAYHFLTVPDPGPEGEVHNHHFKIELQFAGNEINQYGYLLDIDVVDQVLDDLIDRYGDQLLNDLPEFHGHNPSVEHFAKVVGDRVEDAVGSENLRQLTVRVWEDSLAWASHTRELA